MSLSSNGKSFGEISLTLRPKKKGAVSSSDLTCRRKIQHDCFNAFPVVHIRDLYPLSFFCWITLIIKSGNMVDVQPSVSLLKGNNLKSFFPVWCHNSLPFTDGSFLPSNWWNSSAEDSATPNEFPYCCIWKKPSITPCSRPLIDFTFISMGLVSQLPWVEKNSLSAPAASMHHGVPGTHRPLSYKILQVEASPFFPKPAST